MAERLDECFDAYVEGERFEQARLLEAARTSPYELAFAWDKRWQPGEELRIRFVDGHPDTHRLVEEVAREWLRHANLRFSFGNYPDARIEISFEGSGYKSLVGTDAQRRDPTQPTMQLGGIDADTDPVELRRTVLHEFGHAIGCVHEQASPAAAIPWDEEKVYAHFRRWQGWDRETTYLNVLQRYSPEAVRFTAFDATSIMQYPVAASLTLDGTSIPWNDDLSPQDIEFIGRMYPR